MPLATAIYANQLGLRCVSLLMRQDNAHYVRRNLLAGQHFGARVYHYRNLHHLRLGFFSQLGLAALRHGILPRVIPAGGSCPLGVVGYVNAALELRDQITAGVLPAPAFIYVPLGSMGTAAGLMLGLRAVGLATRVIPVRVIDEKMASPTRLLRLIRATESLLRRCAPVFPHVEVSAADLAIRNDCLGEGYARFTTNAVHAAERVRRSAGITLNGTYSAKAFAALLDDARKEKLGNSTVLFWNTYNSRDLSGIATGSDYRRLPKGFYRYFEEDVQPLDRSGCDR